MSLVDQSMIPFQTAYPMIVVLIWQILAGNTGFVSPLLIDEALWHSSFIILYQPVLYVSDVYLMLNH